MVEALAQSGEILLLCLLGLVAIKCETVKMGMGQGRMQKFFEGEAQKWHFKNLMGEFVNHVVSRLNLATEQCR